MREMGHAVEFSFDEEGTRTVEEFGESKSDTSDEGSSEERDERDPTYSSFLSFLLPSDEDQELDDILADPYACTEPCKYDILKHVDKVYFNSRGYELGIVSLP